MRSKYIHKYGDVILVKSSKSIPNYTTKYCRYCGTDFEENLDIYSVYNASENTEVYYGIPY